MWTPLVAIIVMVLDQEEQFYGSPMPQLLSVEFRIHLFFANGIRFCVCFVVRRRIINRVCETVKEFTIKQVA